MENGLRRMSPAIFALALICFFLPFVEMSCQGQKILTLTGIQLATGTTIAQPAAFGQAQTRRVSGEPSAVVALLSAIVGLGLSFLKNGKAPIGPAIAGGLGLVTLLLLKSKMDGDILREGGGMIQVEYAVGFWTTFILYASALALNAFLLMQTKRKNEKQV